MRIGAPPLPALLWRLSAAWRAIASAPRGGGISDCDWVINAQVARDYERTDVETHLEEIAAGAGVDGDGVGFLTAARVEQFVSADDDGVVAHATVGLSHPRWAAGPDEVMPAVPIGTVNIVAFVPVRLSDAALVNAVITVTEAKAQALAEAKVPGTGTASDAVCVVAHRAGPVETFAGPRSTWGARLARATHAVVASGASTWNERSSGS